LITVLHPCHKLSYFKTAKWKEDWIDTAETLVRKTFAHLYTSADVTGNDLDLEHAQDSNKVSSNKTMCSSLLQCTVLTQSTFQPANVFDTLTALAPPRVTNLRTELDRYLAANVEHVTDALVWWHEHHVAYPRLSQNGLGLSNHTW